MLELVRALAHFQETLLLYLSALSQSDNIRASIAIMNHKFGLISTKYVINPAPICIAHYITTDRTLKIARHTASLSQLSCDAKYSAPVSQGSACLQMCLPFVWNVRHLCTLAGVAQNDGIVVFITL